MRLQTNDSEETVTHAAWDTVHDTKGPRTVWKNSEEGHGAFHVKVLAPPVSIATHITLHWSPEVKSMRSGTNIDEPDVATSMHFFSSHSAVKRHRVTFQLAGGEAGGLGVVGRFKTDCTSILARGAVCGMFPILAHSNWHKVCAGRTARHQASRPGPSQADNALVLADTRERSKTVASNQLVAKSSTHDANLASH